MMAEETATAKKGGFHIAIDWTDGDIDNDGAFRRSAPDRGVAPPSSSWKRDGEGGELARSSHVRSGTRIHIEVCFTSPPSSAPKVKGDVSAGKGTKVRRDAAVETEGEFDALRRDIAGMTDDELRREIAGLSGTLRRFQERLRLLLEAEARKWKQNAYSRSSANRSGDVYFVSLPSAAAKDTKGRRDAAAEAEVEFVSGHSNEGLRREIAMLSDAELRREIDNTHSGSQPRLTERRRRLLPLLEAEARKRKANACSGSSADRGGGDVSFVSPPPSAAKGKKKRRRDV